jgi:cyclin D2
MYTPSIIAAASIAAALDGLEWTVKSGCSLNQLLDRLHIITAIERVSLGSLKICADKIFGSVVEKVTG